MEALKIFFAGGPVMYPLLLISLMAVAIAVERFIAYTQFAIAAPGLVDEVLDLLRKGRGGDALRRAEEVPGPVATAITTVLRNRDVDIEDVEREVEVATEDYFVRLERFLPVLDTFTTLSPLLGLLGTILGMVRVFQQFTAAANDEAAKATILAGVGEALYATAFGIAIAIFCFAAYNYFAARQRSVSIAAQQATTKLIAYLHGLKAPASPTIEELVTRKRLNRADKRIGRQLKKTKIEIIPMIDTMFFLLVFFILSSVGIIKLEGLPVNLPEAVSSERQKPAEITISIDANQQMKINNTTVKPGDNVATILQHEIDVQTTHGTAQQKVNAEVVINADRAVPSGVVVQTLNDAASVGVGRVSIATQNLGAGGAAPVPPPGGQQQ
jgi:biopolymer transport protein ExbB/TolQ/biopolymer transport protein ExbD